jgi:hypothetical protein
VPFSGKTPACYRRDAAERSAHAFAGSQVTPYPLNARIDTRPPGEHPDQPALAQERCDNVAPQVASSTHYQKASQRLLI